MFHILLADDDEELSDLLSEYLSAHDLKITPVYDGKSALEIIKKQDFDCLILDIMMPKLDGIEVLTQLREFSQLPVIMLTAKGDDVDRIIGLELGADDYLPKPCNPRELLARINAICKRTSLQRKSPTLPEHTRMKFDLNVRTCSVDGTVLALTGSEFDLLLALFQNFGETVSKDHLCEQALQRTLMPFDRSIDVHISRLRQKLRPFSQESIKSVRGKGYQLVLE